MSPQPIRLLDDLTDDEYREISQNSYNSEFPAWVIPKGDAGYRIIDNVFVEDFCEGRGLKCINGILYNEDGRSDDRLIKSDIQNAIKPWCDTGLSNRTASLLEAVKNESFCPAPELLPNVIHCLDGAIKINLDGSVKYLEKEFALNRMNASMILTQKVPERWMNFLNDLLEKDDILTLQEYMGYCLIPTTRAQAMLFLIGRGGEGKSRIGVILNALFKSSMITGKLNDLQDDKFAGAQLENRLLFLDDDLKGTKLKDTDLIKSIVTAETPMQVQRKGVDMYSVNLYSRLMAFGNQAMSSIFDRSDGFYRRQIILECKKRPKDRTDDTDLSGKLLKEKQEIFSWMVSGLQRLVKNGYKFTRSERSLQYMDTMKENDNNVIAFMRDPSAVEYAQTYETTSRELYDAYYRWCSSNAETPLAERTVLNFLKNNAEEYGIRFSYNLIRPGYTGRYRGYKGLRVISREGFRVPNY